MGIFSLVYRAAEMFKMQRKFCSGLIVHTLWPLLCLFHSLPFWPFFFYYELHEAGTTCLFGFLTSRPRSYGSSELYWAAFWYKSTVGMKYKADRNHFALWWPNRTQVFASSSQVTQDSQLPTCRCHGLFQMSDKVMLVGGTQYPAYLSQTACLSHTPSAVFHRLMQVAQISLDIAIHG